MVCKEGYFGSDCGCTPQDDNCVEEEVITPEPTTNPATIPESPTIFSTANISDENTVKPTSLKSQQSTIVFSPEASITGSIVSMISITTTTVDQTTTITQPTSTNDPTSIISGSESTSLIQVNSSNVIITPTGAVQLTPTNTPSITQSDSARPIVSTPIGVSVKPTSNVQFSSTNELLIAIIQSITNTLIGVSIKLTNVYSRSPDSGS